MVRVQARSQVFMIVVEGEQLCRPRRDFEYGVERGIEPPRLDFGNDRVPGLTCDAEHVPVMRTIRCAR